MLLLISCMFVPLSASASQLSPEKAKECQEVENELFEIPSTDNSQVDDSILEDTSATRESIPEVPLNNSGITTLASGGQWIQAADGRWWYQHADGSYTTNGWELINGKWYYFDAQGWMLTGWIQLNGNWYYLDSSGAMVTGWQKINGIWYYFSSQGVMQTGWHHLAYSGTNNGAPYYSYFNSDGALVTDSDILGCSHGYSTFSDRRYSSDTNNITFYSNCSSSQLAQIDLGVRSWNGHGIAFFRKLTTNTASVTFTYYTFPKSNTLAATQVWASSKNWIGVSSSTTNWSKVRILVDNDQGTISSGTIAHEIGHALGLSHKITDIDSIMCQVKNGRRVSTPQFQDIATAKHIYGK